MGPFVYAKRMLTDIDAENFPGFPAVKRFCGKIAPPPTSDPQVLKTPTKNNINNNNTLLFIFKL